MQNDSIKHEQIGIHYKADMYIFDISEINEDILLEIFVQNFKQVIYITDKKLKDKLIGIVTSGDFCRYCCNKMNIQFINHRFTSVTQDTEQEIQDIFHNKKNIFSIPVINNKGKIIKEYYRNPEAIQYNMREICAFVEYLCKVIRVKCIVLVDCPQEYLISLQNLTDTSDLVNVSNIFPCDDIKNNKKYFVYDICEYADIKARQIFCDKYDFNHFWIRVNLEDLRLKLAVYKAIGIFTKDKLLMDIIQFNKCIFLLDDSKCSFCKKEGFYKYRDTNISNLECILMFECPTEKAYMMINNTLVPIISIKCDNQQRWAQEALFADMDIAFNILPKLSKHHIQYMIINNINCESNNSVNFSSNRYNKKGDLYQNWKSDIETTEIIEFLCPEHEKKREKVWDIVKFPSFIKERGYTISADYHSNYVNYSLSERFTCGNPEVYENTIYLFGPCMVKGVFVEDKDTLGSNLRKKIPDSYYIKNCGDSWQNKGYLMRKQIYHSGDIVLVFAFDTNVYHVAGIETYSISQAYQKIPDLNAHIWDTLNHFNSVVTKYIADEIFEILQKNQTLIGINKNLEKAIVQFGIAQNKKNIPDELRQWIKFASKYVDKHAEYAGAIVMNCNPFTLGHRYLIEYASKRVDILYVFVVEENKSFFDFHDRYKMVKLGTSDIKNVVVIPSGKYIISTETLPGYFDKEDNPFVTFDATDDLEIFATIIAKEFNISVRFAGEEPLDVFTKKYNQSMKELLPSYDIKFIEIPRKKFSGEVISASRVRRYMKEKNYTGIKDMVMPEIYSYLEEHYLTKDRGGNH